MAATAPPRAMHHQCSSLSQWGRPIRGTSDCLASQYSITGVFPTTLSSWYTTADVNYRHNLYCGPNARLDALAGYRFALLQDELYLGEPPDSSRDEHENNRIAVSNRFHGGQVGLAGEYDFTGGISAARRRLPSVW